MLADRTVLQPDPAEANGLERRTGNPDRREEVALTAPYDNIAAHSVAATPRDESPPDKHDKHEDKGDDGLDLRPIFTYRSGIGTGRHSTRSSAAGTGGTRSSGPPH